MNPLEYFGFAARFAINPRAALQPYQGLTTIDPSLAVYGLAGSLLGAAIIAISIWTGFAQRDDIRRSNGPILPRLILPPWSWIAWPSSSAAVIVSLTAIMHGFAAGWHVARTWLGIEIFDETLGGGWPDTVNALFAVNALLSPLFAVVIAVAPRVPQRFEFVLTLPLVFAVFGYPILAVAAAHPQTSLNQALTVLSAPLAVPMMVLLMSGWVLRTVRRFLINIRRQH